jgi:hypothetical protein
MCRPRYRSLRIRKATPRYGGLSHDVKPVCPNCRSDDRVGYRLTVRRCGAENETNPNLRHFVPISFAIRPPTAALPSCSEPMNEASSAGPAPFLGNICIATPHGSLADHVDSTLEPRRPRRIAPERALPIQRSKQADAPGPGHRELPDAANRALHLPRVIPLILVRTTESGRQQKKSIL